MAVLNIRVEDRVRDQLKAIAEDHGVSLSEYVRDLLMENVVPVCEPEAKHGDEPAPDSMRTVDRQVLSLLHRILGRVLSEDSNDVDGDLEYQLMRAKILEEGYTGEYWYETAGFRTELSKRDCGRVSDILQMFRIITFSIDHLEKEGTPVDEKLGYGLEFQGFDHNDELEGHMASYVTFLIRDDRWKELEPQLKRNDKGNSHHLVLDTYLRMLSEYRRIMDGRKRRFDRMDYLLSLDELKRIAEARVHPSNRSRVSADMCDDCLALHELGVRGRHTPPHLALEAVGPRREMSNGNLRADEQDYRCTACGRQWMHETGNSGQGWLEGSF